MCSPLPLLCWRDHDLPWSSLAYGFVLGNGRAKNGLQGIRVWNVVLTTAKSHGTRSAYGEAISFSSVIIRSTGRLEYNSFESAYSTIRGTHTFRPEPFFRTRSFAARSSFYNRQTIVRATILPRKSGPLEPTAVSFQTPATIRLK